MFAIHDITACHRTHKMSNTSKKKKKKSEHTNWDRHTQIHTNLWHLCGLSKPTMLNSPPPLCFPQSFVFARLWRQWRLLTSCPPLIVWLLAPIELTMTICAELCFRIRSGSRWRRKFWYEPDGTVNGTSVELQRSQGRRVSFKMQLVDGLKQVPVEIEPSILLNRLDDWHFPPFAQNFKLWHSPLL